MPRKRPTSTRQKKAETQLKRAIKRGDAPPPDPSLRSPQRRPKARRIGPTGAPVGAANATHARTTRLESRFLTLPQHYLEETKSLTASLLLRRPIPSDALILSNIPTESSTLACPKRPKWRFDMTKKEVERNEEGYFKKWMGEVDSFIQRWREGEHIQGVAATLSALELMPRSHTYYERNLEVWRQLWRVVEISQIILVLLDSRCPLVHFPPSLRAYLDMRRVILVLTKVDISGQACADAWVRYLQALSPGVRVVQVESYAPKGPNPGHQKSKGFESHLPRCFRDRLIEAIREVHADLLEPPEKVKTNPTWAAKWKPPVKRDIHWDSVYAAVGDQVGKVLDADFKELNLTEDEEPPFLTIGLIGQPNVGKSSLLNALFGTQRVRASKTPGKTKHFQTLFWTSDIRLVDCPGLVMPNFIPMEIQVLSGVLPISNVSAVPACIYYAAQVLPLEEVLHLSHSSSSLPQVEDKRTWREGMKPSCATEQNKRSAWTALDILTAYANSKGWVTAKAGRPDMHRAGNAILRALAEGRIPWAFWPPDADPETVNHHFGKGIWIPNHETLKEISEDESEVEDNLDESAESSDDGGLSTSDVEVDSGHLGRFSALSLDDGNGTDED